MLAFAVSASILFAYLWIDRSISLSYARQGEDTAIGTVRGLELILEHEWRGLPEPEVFHKLNAVAAQGAGAKIVVKKEGNIIWFDEVRFNFDEGRLKSIGDK
ncbi:Imm58 family immunity protein [Ralstonia pseudosolanacearum]|nr:MULTISPECIES: Imm58 family immunity protein [Ralstonia]MCD9230636.1 immunity protein 58 [Ralstonia pseudosolanacearum]MDC6283434.1 Imm58 family immunity protein [Ralstonia pseudosolanacearum]MDC6294324.1 Imm58 family immunity protein [Ralstonia pseudosolanacearum]MDN3368462.1 Imm58 family immunity protein [Ralstonia pseudosolanacearum]MDO3507612.1 Imm58 family immunity protein [Ralstonia pseudosolanacearum]